MAYLALYRKYRPMTFDEVVGQKHLVTTLKSAINNNKVAHAYLFCGPRGTGKTTVARLIAKAVNCEAEVKPCGKCRSCLEIQGGNHPDIIEIDAASNNGVDEIRDLIEKVKYSPIEAKFKIYIIDEVHMLSTSAFNALLKTLEDPPSHVIFILATTEAHKILPTIVSRCQRFDFLKVDNHSLIERMQSVVESEKLVCQAGLLKEIASLAEGGMRDALSILDQLAAYCDGELTIESLNEVYGLLSNSEKIKLLIDITTNNNTEVLRVLDKVDEQGLDIRRLTNELAEIIKEGLIYLLTSDDKLLRKVTKEEIREMLKVASQKKLLKLIDILLETAEKYRNVSNANIYFETCLLKMLSIGDENSVVLVEESPKEALQPIKKETKKIEIEAIKGEVEEPKEAKEAKEEVESFDDIVPILEVVENKQLTDEYIYTLLLRADISYRRELQENWQKIGDFLYDEKYARAANPLRNCEVFAAGNDFVIVSNPHKEVVEQINQTSCEAINTELFNAAFKKYKKVFAIEANKTNHYLGIYNQWVNSRADLKAADKFDFSHLMENEEIEEVHPIFSLFDDVEVI